MHSTPMRSFKAYLLKCSKNLGELGIGKVLLDLV